MRTPSSVLLTVVTMPEPTVPRGVGRPHILGEPLAPLTMRIPAEVKRLIQERAEAEGCSLSEVLRPVLEREFRPAPEG